MLTLTNVRSTTADNSEAQLIAGQIVHTDKSGCYQNDGSKFTVSVIVDWDTAGEITISLDGGAQTRVIAENYSLFNEATGKLVVTHDTITRQQVSFELDADGTSGHTIEVYYSADPSNIIASKEFIAPPPCEPIVCGGSDLGGFVFNDYDLNGVRSAGETTGVPFVNVTAIDSNGTMSVAQTDYSGAYSISGLSYPVRVEFSNIPDLYNETSTPVGANNGTTVQFFDGPSCDASIGVLDPSDYCQANPLTVATCYVNGNPLVNDPAIDDTNESFGLDALVGFPYELSGLKDINQMTMLSTAGDIGSAYGIAYDPYTETLYTSAVLRRHAGLGPLGLGGIYAIDMSGHQLNDQNSVSMVNSFDITSLGANVGTIASNEDRGLSSDATLPSVDAQSFAKIGKAGIGDIDIDALNGQLYLTNLNSGKLLRVSTDGTEIAAWKMPFMCEGGTLRPWALKYYKGLVYVGAVCDAQQSQDVEDLSAGVYLFDTQSESFSLNPVFTFPLTYPKGYAQVGARAKDNGWYPWSDDWNTLLGASNTVTYPTPIFADIEFDIDGSMVLSILDRTAMQTGAQNYDPDGLGQIEGNIAGGDILRAYFSNGTYILENNGKAGPNIGYGVDNAQGPGFGEFYNDNLAYNGSIPHAENVTGGLAIRPGSGQVAVSIMDPIDSSVRDTRVVRSGGVRYMNNQTGQSDYAYQIYQTPAGSTGPTFSKAAGIGDVEFICELPKTLEIGNRIWFDDNFDGIQDPSEGGVADMKVELYDANGALVDETRTDANGEYAFGNLVPNSQYYVVLPPGVFTGGKLKDAPYPSVPFQGESHHDSNAVKLTSANFGGLPANLEGSIGASVVTGNYNENDHTIDMGFSAQENVPIIGDYVWVDTNQDGIQDPEESGIKNVVVNLYNDKDQLVNITSTNSDGYYIFEQTSDGERLTEGGYYAVFELPGGYKFTKRNASGDEATDSDVDANGKTGTHQVGPTDSYLLIDAGVVPIMSLGSHVFIDSNGNDVLGSGDARVEGIEVQLLDANKNVLDTTVTDGNGLYLFKNLIPGDYYVRIPTPPADAPLSVIATEEDPNTDIDQDDNGIQAGGSGTPTVSGLISLVPNSEPVDGVENPPGRGGDAEDDRNGNMTIDFGFVAEAPVVVETMSLGSTVWIDSNNTGLIDNGERGIAGVTVELYDENDNLIDSQVTINAGRYFFTNLTPGKYYVAIPNPPAVAPMSSEPTETDPNDDVDNNDNGLQPDGAGTRVVSNLIDLQPNQEPIEDGAARNMDDADELNGNMTLDFGFFAPDPVVSPASLGNYVWLDDTQDGVQNDTETGLADVEVTLTPPAGVDIGAGPGISIMTTTDNDGFYLFDNLPPADGYVVEVDSGQPVLRIYEYTTAHNPGNDGGNQDPNGYTINLSSGEYNPTADFGFFFIPEPTAVSFSDSGAGPVSMILFTGLALVIALLLGFVFYRRRNVFQ